MSDITVAADQTAATKLLADAEVLLGTKSSNGGGSLGPFSATWGASVSFSGGTVTLTPPNIIEIDNCTLNYSLSFSFSLDLNDFLPSFCIPQICIFGFCTPSFCVTWPTITIPFSYSDSLTFSADFTLNPHLTGGTWFVDIVIVGIPQLDLSVAAAAIIAGLGAAIAAVLAPIPLIGPFLAGAVVAITAAIGIAGITGLLGSILTPFVSGLTFTITLTQQVLTVVPASLPLDAAVNIKVLTLGASVVASDKNELVLTADISA